MVANQKNVPNRSLSKMQKHASRKKDQQRTTVQISPVFYVREETTLQQMLERVLPIVCVIQAWSKHKQRKLKYQRFLVDYF